MWFYHLQLCSFHFWQVNAFATPVLSHFYPTTLFHFFLPKVCSFNFRSILHDSHFSKTHLPQPFPMLPWCFFALFVSGCLIHAFSKHREIRYFPCARRCGRLWWAVRGYSATWGWGSPVWPCTDARSAQMPGLKAEEVRLWQSLGPQREIASSGGQVEGPFSSLGTWSQEWRS